MSCDLHGDGECDCPAYLIVMGQNDLALEAALEQPGFAALETLDWRSIVGAAGSVIRTPHAESTAHAPAPARWHRRK